MTEQSPSLLSNPVIEAAVARLIKIGESNPDELAKFGRTYQEEIADLLAKTASLRAESLRQYSGDYGDENRANQALEQIFADLASQSLEAAHHEEAEGLKLFQQALGRVRYGIVFTAHPTFAFAPEIMEKIGSLATNQTPQGEELSLEAKLALLKDLAQTNHAHNLPITLEQENEEAEQAIDQARRAIRLIYQKAFQQAAQYFPTAWQSLELRLLDLASWVGGDMDGRNDINWYQSLSLRWLSCGRNMQRMERELALLAHQANQANHPKAYHHLKGIADDMGEFAKILLARSYHIAQLGTITLTELAALSRELANSPPKFHQWQCSAYWGDRLKETLSYLPPHAEIGFRLAALRADFLCHGLGSSLFHVRLNATQIHNAMRGILELTGEPTDPSLRRGAMRKLLAALADVKPIRISFNSLQREKNSARRMFMLVRQWLTHGDPQQPIRFLIAESDSPFTILSALYLAKHYGVDANVDISPLFETASALKHGASIIAELCTIPAFRAYLKVRGRLSIQTGFSDAGRQLGQVAAALAVERLQMKLAEVMLQANVTDCELLLFNTHGESMGRGAHPASFSQRFRYLWSPMARDLIDKAGIEAKPEVSFQGGDGYLRFATPKLALASLTEALLDHPPRLARPYRVKPTEPSIPDPFYQQTDQSLEFFVTLQDYNQRLMEDKDFGQLLTYFAPRLFAPSGSRHTIRQTDPLSVSANRSLASQLRAIPQNAALQQLGWLATVFFGTGRAIGRDREWFIDMVGKSERLELLMRMAGEAKLRSDSDFLMAYLELHNPALWLRLAVVLPMPMRRSARHVAKLLMDEQFYPAAQRVALRMIRDALYLDMGLAETPLGSLISQGNQQPHRQNALNYIRQLHEIRLTIMMQLFLHIPKLPAFSSTSSLRVEHIMQTCLRLDIDQALSILWQAFPTGEAGEILDFGEPADDDNESHDYRHERHSMFQPLQDWQEAIHKISLCLGHIYGAHG